ncbi:MAG TPA: metal-dependent hydrolase [Candidatus Xenobia bacterium]|nr:metal-dependent hydrolase [Candidatus Xenobia bacterium]
MDTISTGIGGALLARALPERWRGPSGLGVVVFASVVPDADVVADFFLDELGRIAQHRSFTHSLLGVVVMAPLGALVARRLGKDKNYGRLLGLMTYGLLWHLVTDLGTSWGTQVFYPFSRERAVWDWMFIIDFIFTSILLLPLVLAWIYRDRGLAMKRGAASWAALTAFTALMISWAAPFFDLSFQWRLFALLSAALVALFLLPALGGWGFRIPGATFARLGVVALVAYYTLCASSHYAALKRVEALAPTASGTPTAVAAIPQPLSPLRWSGLVRTRAGIYQNWFSLAEPETPPFEFFRSENNDWVLRAEKLPEVQTYLWFARFPVARYRPAGSLPGRTRAGAEAGDTALPGDKARETGGGAYHIVEWSDRRFNSWRRRRPAFAFRVIFNDRGEVLEVGFDED